MRNDTNRSTAGNGPTSWMGWKEKAKSEYEQGRYEDALISYRTCITSYQNYCPADERQIILSNMVACRLKIGGVAQAEAAVTTAKQVGLIVYIEFKLQQENDQARIRWHKDFRNCRLFSFLFMRKIIFYLVLPCSLYRFLFLLCLSLFSYSALK